MNPEIPKQSGWYWVLFNDSKVWSIVWVGGVIQQLGRHHLSRQQAAAQISKWSGPLVSPAEMEEVNV